MSSFSTQEEDPDAQTEDLNCSKNVGATGVPFSMTHVSDIWLNVFDKLETQDKPAFHRACEKWHVLVAPIRTQFLFQGVLPMLIEAIPENEVLLQCRELCHSWTQEMDLQIQTHRSQLKFPFEIDSDEGSIVSINNQINFYQGNYQQEIKIQRFLETMEKHPGNPFPGSSIYFGFKWDCWEWEYNSESDPGPDICREFWNKAIELLTKFGTHIHYVWFDPDVSCCRLGLPGLEMEAILRNCLLNMKNLKRLSIRGIGYSNATENEIREFYEKNPFPLLENLETVEFYGCGSFAMVQAVLNLCCVPSKIKRLALNNSEEIGSNRLAYKFPNLEVLSTDLFNQNLEIFRKLKRPPPLKKLRLDGAGITAQQLYWALEPFAETLMHLNIWNSKLALDLEDMRINFPNLKRLRINA